MMTRERQKILDSIRRRLRPIGAVYDGHPDLSRSAAFSVLRNAPMNEVESMCHQLSCNVGELMVTLEKQRIITVYRPAKRKRKKAAVLFS